MSDSPDNARARFGEIVCEGVWLRKEKGVPVLTVCKAASGGDNITVLDRLLTEVNKFPPDHTNPPIVIDLTNFQLGGGISGLHQARAEASTGKYDRLSTVDMRVVASRENIIQKMAYPVLSRVIPQLVHFPGFPIKAITFFPTLQEALDLYNPGEVIDYRPFNG